MADPKMEIINDCAKALCKFFGRDPDETVYIPTGVQGSVTVQRPLWRLVRGRIFECVAEVSKIIEPPPNGGGNAGTD